jgi:hypothetical protein
MTLGVVPAKAGTHTPRPIDRAIQQTPYFKQQAFVVMGPGLRRDDSYLRDS